MEIARSLTMDQREGGEFFPFLLRMLDGFLPVTGFTYQYSFSYRTFAMEAQQAGKVTGSSV